MESRDSSKDRRRLEILEEIFGSYTKSGREHLFSCKFCNHHKKKLSINIEKNCYKCWVCNKSGKSITRLVIAFGNTFQKQKWQLIEPDSYFMNQQHEIFVDPTITLPEEFISATSGNLKQYIINS
jgi:hypothetical protein